MLRTFRPRQNRQRLDLALILVTFRLIVFRKLLFLAQFNMEIKYTRKVSKAVGIYYKSSFCLNNSCLRTLYYSPNFPYLFYCVSVWASSYPSNLRRLITVQKRVKRRGLSMGNFCSKDLVDWSLASASGPESRSVFP